MDVEIVEMVHPRFKQDSDEVIRRVRAIREDVGFLHQLLGEYNLDQVGRIEDDIEDESIPSSEIVENLRVVSGMVGEIKRLGVDLAPDVRDLEQTGIHVGSTLNRMLEQSKRWK